MTSKIICIGLPVYNGQNFIAEAIDSILHQTFTDFSLLISDNASTDQTETICRSYAAVDSRISYIRNPKNIGASDNFNQTFLQSRSKYFKWAAHDDFLDPRYLEKCIQFMEENPHFVLCYSKTKRVNALGVVDGNYDYDMRVSHPDLRVRFADLILINHFCISTFGVFRRDVLRKTNLIGKYVGSDRTLLAETALYGPQYEIPEYLFYRRHHPNASTAKYAQHERLAWFDPDKHKNINLKYWKAGLEYFRSVNRVPITIKERIACYFLIIKWFIKKRKQLLGDLIIAIYRFFPFTKSIVHTIKRIDFSHKGGSK
jgi:glycosyltransferase involved in cell wall biosynthesis